MKVATHLKAPLLDHEHLLRYHRHVGRAISQSCMRRRQAAAVTCLSPDWMLSVEIRSRPGRDLRKLGQMLRHPFDALGRSLQARQDWW